MVGRVISAAFDAYGALFPVLVGVAAALAVPFQAALLAVQLAANDPDEAETGALLIGGLGSALLILPLITVVAIRAAQARERGGRPDPRAALQEGVELLPAIAGTQLLVVLAIAALPGLVILLGLSADSPGVVAGGLAALLVSAVVNGVRMSLALPVLLLEGPRYGAALRRSGELVRGAWRPAFLTLLAIFGCALLLELAATAAVAPLAGDSDAATAVAQRVVAAVATVLVGPFVALATLGLYRELHAAKTPT